MIKSIILSIISFLLTSVLTYILNSTKRIKKESKLIKQGLLSLQRAELTELCEKYLEKGFCPDYARYVISDLFTNYSELGGNHGMNVLVDRTLMLPLKVKYNRRKEDVSDEC